MPFPSGGGGGGGEEVSCQGRGRKTLGLSHNKKSYGKERERERTVRRRIGNVCEPSLAGKCFFVRVGGVLVLGCWVFFLLPSSFFLEVGAYSWRRRRGPLVFSLSSPPFFRGYPSVASTKVIVRKGKCKNPDKEAPCFPRHPTYFSPDGRAPLFSDKLRGLEIREHCCIPKRGGETRRLKSPGGIFLCPCCISRWGSPFMRERTLLFPLLLPFPWHRFFCQSGFFFSLALLASSSAFAKTPCRSV